MAFPTFFLLAVMACLLMSGVWIGFALMATGVISLEYFRDSPVMRQLARDIWGSMTSEELVTLPLFILKGELLYHTGASERLFNGLAPWVRRLPGGLLHVNVLGCTLFGAVTGSTAATTATVGRMTLPELAKRGYDRNLSVGSLAGAGTIGLLIPPSIPLIVYGVLAEASILDLFIAGILPSLIIAASYLGWIVLRAGMDPRVAPIDPEPVTWRDRWLALGDLLPVVLLIVLVIGSMYTGLASVTEAAAIGVAGALVVAAYQRTLNWANVRRALFATVRTCSMLGLILCGALFAGKAMTLLGIPQAVTQWVGSLGLAPFALIIALLLVYFVLGTALDGLSAMVMTLPVALPLVLGAGFDKIWFGVFIVVTIELSNISPPVGFSLFVIQQLTGHSQTRVALAAAPFCLLLCAFVAVMALAPEVITWLPKTMKG
jgi:tripartite ATP-independent transporter DctM subunit